MATFLAPASLQASITWITFPVRLSLSATITTLI
jgi:hypothetical protein